MSGCMKQRLPQHSLVAQRKSASFTPKMLGVRFSPRLLYNIRRKLKMRGAEGFGAGYVGKRSTKIYTIQYGLKKP